MKGFQWKKKQVTLHKMCVTSLLCGPWADLRPFYGFLCKRFSLSINRLQQLPHGPHRREVKHILCNVNCFFYWNPFIFIGYRNDRFFQEPIKWAPGFSPYKSLYFECYATMPMLIFPSKDSFFLKKNCMKKAIFHQNHLSIKVEFNCMKPELSFHGRA